MEHLPNLHWLRAFEAAARKGSFTAAAAELALTQAAVSHQVRSLEKTFGVRLFHRRSRHLELTEVGRAYYPSVARSLENMAIATRGLFGPSSKQVVTVCAPISTSAYWLAPRIARFREQHPNVQIRLLSSLWADVVPDEHVDVDIRLGTGVFAGYTAQKLGEETMVPICAPGVAESYKSAADIALGDLIHIHGYQDHWAAFFRALRTQAPFGARSGVYADTTVTALEMVSAGHGLAMIMSRLARPLSALGRVAIPVDHGIPMGQAHYLLTPLDAPMPHNETRALRDWITREFESG